MSINTSNYNNNNNDLPWLFSATAAQTPNTLALARAGGNRGQTYTYIDDSIYAALGTPQGYCSTLATGSRRNTTLGGKHHHQQRYTSNAPTSNSNLPPSPPSSVSPPTGAVHIPPRPFAMPQYILPPSPNASLGRSVPAQSWANSMPAASATPSAPTPTQSAAARCGPVLPLINSVFPYAASSVAAASHMLEIVTPPASVLKGFITDDDALGRCVFVHLPPTLSAPAPDPLAPHFSDVLRPHDPRRDHPSAPSRPRASAALDIRESLTALLDLADTLDATQLLLVLDKDERETALLAELMHSLMFVGGIPVRPGVPVGEWDWDSTRWALVSIEL